MPQNKDSDLQISLLFQYYTNICNYSVPFNIACPTKTKSIMGERKTLIRPGHGVGGNHAQVLSPTLADESLV